jgi:serine/threonine-protein kinase
VTAQEVAIKILPPELAVHDDLKARFVEEARVLAKLEHPNIVGLNNFLETGGRLCLVMTYVPGKTFEQMILDANDSGTKLDVRECVRVGVEVLKALEYAHGQNVIHRDIKPSNVLVRPDGAVKVTDFGIAKIIGQSRLTSTGQTMGTVRYMSPEQVRGKALDARSDLYSLGITLYEALAGKTPFDGENQFDIMQQQITKAPPPFRSHGVEVPASLERVLKSSLEKDPQKRFPDAKTFREALENLTFEGDDQTHAGSKRAAAKDRGKQKSAKVRAVALGLGIGVAAVGALAGVYRFQHRPVVAPPPPKVTNATPSNPPAVTSQWIAPHAVAGLTLSSDQTFDTDQLRIQSASPRDLARVRERAIESQKLLQKFLAEQQAPSVRALKIQPLPLTITVVPQAILNRPDLWPGFEIKSDSTYPSRYIAGKRTLFVNDAKGFERRDLAYGIALHVLAPLMPDAECLDLADKFETYFAAHAAP